MAQPRTCRTSLEVSSVIEPAIVMPPLRRFIVGNVPSPTLRTLIAALMSPQLTRIPLNTSQRQRCEAPAVLAESLETNAHWVFNKLTGHLVVSINCLVKYCQSASRRLVGGILKFKAVWKNQESPWLQPGECQ
ncbi:hypothetical protein [Nostoc commune]|uniref:hypothetical protein n=1 Tax=Nostoc commune TaxID=1178 RepID=UPI0018C78648|nr:hypothetical protein [Nostoc commune]MBG1261767.1 hypothetical protein [Nostoc commune BAE]